MRLRAVVAATALAVCAVTACAQSEIVSVTGWRMHDGDNPAWARPDLDDSSWTPSDYPRMVLNDSDAGWHWYRATFEVPADFHEQQLGVGFAALDDVYEVYIEGVPIGQFGSFEPAPHAIFARHLFFSIPTALLKGSTGHIAIRRWRGRWSLRLIVLMRAGMTRLDHPAQLGGIRAIEALEEQDTAAGAIQNLPWDLSDLAFVFGALIGFVLYSTQRRKREYLYLGLFCITSGLPFLLGIAVSTSDKLGSRSWEATLVFLTVELSRAVSLAFLAEICPRFRRVLRFGAYFAIAAALIWAYGLAMDAGYEDVFIFTIGWVLPFFELLAVWGLMLDRNRGSMAIAMALLLHRSVQTWNNTLTLMRKPLPSISAGPFLIDPRGISAEVLVIVVLVVLYLRYREEQARQAASEQNLAAARRMQEQLLGTAAVDTSGFVIDAVYRPAQEVGGDFYRTEPLEDGSLLVVVGDVSGKGLDAALLVAAVLGGLAIEKERGPARLLEDLNKAVTGRTGGGFITACCARFYPNGRVVIANAGHISPCIDGRELELAAGLPLGITVQAEYSETSVQAGGQRVTFLSDGVVEARNAAGELLGFDRMAALSKKPAVEIADAAQRWGQEDDITVLTVAGLAAK